MSVIEILAVDKERPMAEIKVLLVDDEQDYAETMAFWLKAKGYHVAIAENGELALSSLKA
ncbi:MAG: hypothetical protein HY202_06270, partial [Nitrospirae bacterium]|nr:hypothetical protein [Nitrospirota bacterium]